MTPFIKAFEKIEIPCSIDNPVTQKTEEKTTTIADLFDDTTISGATITHTATAIMSSLITNIKKECDDNNEDLVLKFFRELNKATATPKAAKAFIDKYEMEAVIQNAMEQAILQRDLEDFSAAAAA